MIVFSPVYQLYNPLPKQYRILHHETLGEVLRYPEIPRKSLNFDQYPVFTPMVNRQKTLSNTVTTRHPRAIGDWVITEIWHSDDLSMRTGFFYELMRFFTNGLDAGDYLIWSPKDRTEKSFCIEPLALYCGDQENQDLNPVHNITNRDFRWLNEEVRFEFKIKKIYDVPEVITYIGSL